MLLSDPERLVVDLIGEWSMAAPDVPHNLVINSMRLGRSGERTRIVLDLRQKPADYEIKRVDPTAIEIRVR